MSDSLKGAPRPASESAAEAVARYCREHGIPLPRRREYLPRWHPNIQAYLRNKWEHNAPGVGLLLRHLREAFLCPSPGRLLFARLH